MAGRSLNDILDDLDLSKEERKDLMKRAAKRARKHDHRSFIFYMAGYAVFVSVFGFLIGNVLLDIVLKLAPAGIPASRTVVQIVFWITWLAVMWLLFARLSRHVVKPHVLHLLHEQGIRFCRQCDYLLRDLPPGTTQCPECSAHISKLTPGAAHQHRIPAVSASSRILGVKGAPEAGTIAPDAIERAHVKANPGHAFRMRRISALWAFLIFFALVLGDDVPVPLVESDTYSIIPPFRSFIWAGLAGAVAFLTYLPLRAQHHRDLRMCLREEGIEVCPCCGQYLADEDSSVRYCPRCRNERAPLPKYPA